MKGWSIGTVVGPLLGGLLSNPAQRYPALFGSSALFTTYPYLLPCLVAGLVPALGLLVAVYSLEEVRFPSSFLA